MRKPLDQADRAKGVAARIGPAKPRRAVTMRGGVLYHADGEPVRAGDLAAGHEIEIKQEGDDDA